MILSSYLFEQYEIEEQTRGTAVMSKIGIKHVSPNASNLISVDLEKIKPLAHPILAECSFRQYPSNRFYGIDETTKPSFLVSSNYIYGKYPSTLKPADDLMPSEKGKLCIDQHEWESLRNVTRKGSLRYGDGTNPSLLSRSRLEKHLHNNDTLLTQLRDINASFLATSVFKREVVCDWPKTAINRNRRSVLLLLNEGMGTIMQTTIFLERDARLGRGKIPQPDSGGIYEHSVIFIDDTRLFCHGGQVWITYKVYGEGKLQDFQMFSPLHIEFDEMQHHMYAFIRASETMYACCGRNMAVLEQLDNELESGMKYLSWLDPVTVSSQLLTGENLKIVAARPPDPESIKEQSDFHGTSGFLLHLPDRKEFLGIGHFHRPFTEESQNAFAIYGHHYTHAFFTITDSPPYKLKRLSSEFVFPSKTSGYKHDADIIQFASGLDIIEHNELRYAAIGYGINDCEAAVFFIEMTTVQSMLQPVPEGQQVANLMKPVMQSSGNVTDGIISGNTKV